MLKPSRRPVASTLSTSDFLSPCFLASIASIEKPDASATSLNHTTSSLHPPRPCTNNSNLPVGFGGRWTRSPGMGSPSSLSNLNHLNAKPSFVSSFTTEYLRFVCLPASYSSS